MDGFRLMAILCLDNALRGVARPGMARPGVAGRGEAWRGAAGHGEDNYKQGEIP
jgi:hypothetical protein